MEKDIINKEILVDIGYTFSHIIGATILVLCLKQFSIPILTLLLSLMLGYLSFENMDSIPIYTMVLIGITMYLLNVIVINDTCVESDRKDRVKKNLLNNLWQIPYWGILSYYLIILTRS